MTQRIGIFVGSLTSPNTQRAVENHGWMLGNQFHLDIISTNPRLYETRYYQNTVGEEFPESRSGSVRALNYYITEYSPTILYHLNQPPIHGGLITTLGKRTNATTVYRLPGDIFRHYSVSLGWKKPPYFILNNIVGRVPLFLADKAVVLGPHGRDQLVTRGMSPYNITTLPPSINVDSIRTTSSAKLSVTEERKIVLFVGRHTHLKGINTIEKAIPKILNLREDLQFVFIGKGRDVKVAEKWADHVTKIGPVPPSSMAGYYQKADLLILPSLIEGVPRVLLEALSARTPVIARDTGDIATVTNNTFVNDRQFVELVYGFESLPLDSVDAFSRTSLQDRYVSFFKGI